MKTQYPISLFFILFLFASYTGVSQVTPKSFESAGTGVTTTMANDYQCMGINPANLGFQEDNKFLHFTVLENSFSLTSDGLSRRDIWQTFISNKLDGFSEKEKKEAAKTMSGAGFMFNANLNYASLSIQNENLGGLGIVVRDRINNQVRIDQNLSQLLFLGKNAPYFSPPGNTTSLSDIFSDSRISGSWYREIMVGYGRKLFDLSGINIYGGVDLKYILGYGNLNIYEEEGDLHAYSAITPYMDIDYATTSPLAIVSSGLEPVGEGFGVDIGVTAEFLDMIKTGLSFNDLGSITWDGNTYKAPDINVDSINSEGFDNYNYIQELKNIYQNEHIFNWKGSKEYNTGLPAHMKFGGSIKPIKWFEAGFDIYAPLNNHAANLDKAIFSAGGYFRLANIAKISMGYIDGDIYKNNVPLGFTFIMSNWEMGFSTGDVLTFFRQENPTLSLATGFLRFKLDLPGM